MRRTERGVTLVSVMVGAIIGGIVAASAFASFSFFQLERRRSVGSDTAAQGGLAATIELQRAVKAAGAITMASGQPLCTTINAFNAGAGVLVDGRPIAAVAITDGGGNADTLTLSFASSMFAGTPNRVIAPMASATASLRLSNGIGLAAGDLVVVGAPGTQLPCTLMQVTGLPVSGFNVDLQHTASPTAPWNPPDPAAVFTRAPAYPEGAVVWKTGQLNWLTYRVLNNQLQVTNELSGAVEVIADQVISMKVWYGANDGANKNIEQWVPATGAWAAPTAAQIATLRAVRIGLVVRVAAPTTPEAGGCTATPTATVTLWPGGPAVDLAGLGADWACYVYRTFTLVAPLRNVIYGENA